MNITYSSFPGQSTQRERQAPLPTSSKLKPASSISSRSTFYWSRKTLRTILAWRNSISLAKLRFCFSVARPFIWDKHSITNMTLGTYFTKWRMQFFFWNLSNGSTVTGPRPTFVAFLLVDATCRSFLSWFHIYLPNGVAAVLVSALSAHFFKSKKQQQQQQQQQLTVGSRESTPLSSFLSVLSKWSLQVFRISASVLWRSLSWSARHLHQLVDPPAPTNLAL